ncbi:CoxG family protein [Novosphingobium sp. M1R2S20]|uniref:CoxG family protein n=1 Tax=Novosphingobium rhizovicinum TaxID=3228928 RepID=A0ABV3RG43_9SPHN
MIETRQTVPVDAPIEAAWEYVKTIPNWASLMPGLQSCELLSEDDSRWVLKVGVGALVRTVKVDVHVDQWDGPERVFFTFKLQGDPVIGRGSYHAVSTSDTASEMTLALQVEGTGPMAPMWEAMGGPLLPKFALAFGRQLAEGIEHASGDAQRAQQARPQQPVRQAQPSLIARLLAPLQKLWRRLSAGGAG